MLVSPLFRVQKSLIDLHRFWSSDEYGPYIYRFDATGALIQTIQPPDAIVPLTNGDVDFTGENDPDTGRAANKGKQYGIPISRRLISRACS